MEVDSSLLPLSWLVGANVAVALLAGPAVLAATRPGWIWTFDDNRYLRRGT